MGTAGSTETALAGLDRILPGAESLVRGVQGELPQKDDLCGPTWGFAALRALGVAVTTPEEVAARAGTLLWETDATSRPAGLPPRRDYDRMLPSTPDAAVAGTTADQLVRAIRTLGGEQVRVTHVTTPAGRWGPGLLAEVLDRLVADPAPHAAQEPPAPVAVVANVATEQYVFPTDPAAPQDYLATGSTRGYRKGSWKVGHFVSLLGWRSGPGGRLYRIHDTYDLAGTGFTHDQPAAALARALARPGRTPGSLLVVGRA